jgi:hypothetical protein
VQGEASVDDNVCPAAAISQPSPAIDDPVKRGMVESHIPMRRALTVAPEPIPFTRIPGAA